MEIAIQDNDSNLKKLFSVENAKTKSKNKKSLKKYAFLASTQKAIELRIKLQLPPRYTLLNYRAFHELDSDKKSIFLSHIQTLNSIYLDCINTNLKRLTASSPLINSKKQPDSTKFFKNFSPEWRNIDSLLEFNPLTVIPNKKHCPNNPNPLVKLDFIPPFFDKTSTQKTQNLIAQMNILKIKSNYQASPPTKNEVTSNLHKIADGIFTLALNSNFLLPDFITRALSFGLNYVPDNTHYPQDRLDSDFDEFDRRLRWKFFWFTKNPNESSETKQRFLPLSLRKNIITKPPSNSLINTYVNKIKNDFKDLLQVPSLPTRNRQLAIDINRTVKFFKDNASDILLKPADKGSGTVIIDKSFYISNIEKYITDNHTFFEVVEYDPTPSLIGKISSELLQFKKSGLIDNRTYLMLLPNKEKARCPYLYGLPKIHKLPVAFRPIVSGNGHPTENLSIFVDFLLQPYATLSPFFLKDSTDLQNNLNDLGQLEANSILFSLDVVSMYPNIPLNELIDSNLRCINKNNPKLLHHKNFKYKPELVHKLLELILFNNFFQFNGKFYYQKHGIAMGTPCACSTSDIFICDWIEEVFKLFELKPSFYKQYRDDGFGIWTHGLDNLFLFVDTLNLFHPTLKFTLTHGRSLNYLDLIIRIDDQEHIQTETYYKPTDSFAYLHAESNHPKHCMENIGLSQAIRHIRNCSTFSAYQYHTHFLKYNLIRKGYAHHKVSLKISKINYRQRPTLLKYKKTKRLSRTPLILTYNNKMPPIRRIVKTITNDLLDEDALQAIGGCPIIGFRIQKSTGARIIRAKS